MNALSIALFLPLIGFFVLLFLPRGSKSAFAVALTTTVATFIISLGLIGPAMADGAQFGTAINTMWVDTPGLQIHFHLGIDGINVWLVILTTFLLPVAVWISQ